MEHSAYDPLAHVHPWIVLAGCKPAGDSFASGADRYIVVAR